MPSSGRPIAILQVSKLYSPHIGGVEHVVQVLAEGLRGVSRMRVLVCNTSPTTERTEVNGVPVTRAASFGRMYSMPLSGRFFREFRRECQSADIVHLHVPFPLGDLAALLFRRRGTLIIWWHSDVIRQRVFARFWAPITRRVLRRADRIIVATPNHLLYTAALAEVRDKCVVIPFGIDTKRYELTDATRTKAVAIRKRYGTPQALFVGRLVYYKGVDVLLRAMVEVNGHLLIVGHGAKEAQLKTLMTTLGLEQKVTFLGAVADQNLAAYFHACDVFVLPSTAPSEAFGLVQLEAMACGKPVINTRLESGVPWVSVDGETGLTVSPGEPAPLADAINTLFTDDAKRKLYGRNALARVRAYCDIDVMLQSVLCLYESLG